MPLDLKNIDVVKEVQIARLNLDLSKNAFDLESDLVAVEQEFDVVINDSEHIDLLATPHHIEALTVGALYSANVIDGYADIISMKVFRENSASSIIDVKIKGDVKVKKKISAVQRTLKIRRDDLIKIVEKCINMQKIFPLTGGTHAAGIFDESGKILAFAEDVGRHNAVDKTIGICLMGKWSMHGCGLVISSRVSYEMVTKAARFGLELIAAVSAPTSLAIAMAERYNITVCGFVRANKVNVYTCQNRII